MEANQTQVPSQTMNQSTQYKNCLLVTRHRLLKSQEDDLTKLCKKITKIEALPNDVEELKKTVDNYDAVVGVIPLLFQVQLIQLKKSVLVFYMESLGTAKSKAEADDLLAKSGGEGIILPPSKEGEPYRVSVYRGINKVKIIVVEEEVIIQH